MLQFMGLQRVTELNWTEALMNKSSAKRLISSHSRMTEMSEPVIENLIGIRAKNFSENF